MTRSEVWRLEGAIAHLSLSGLAAAIDLARPGLGLHALQWRGAPLASTQLLAVRFLGALESEELVIADSFVRGPDLVVTYAQTPARPVRLQVYWRALEEEFAGQSAVGVDLQVSVQTNLLASRPALTMCSRTPCETPWSIEKARDHTVCFRCVLAGPTYVEIVHPSDVEQEELSKECDAWVVSHELFASSLEKGVILRARARGLFVADATEGSLVSSMCDRFLSAPLPLTT
ncbi:MAG TPA: hypothetical protein VHD36_05110 [Pirellulales bacterium]|nr:hypothetical protein [Pirellulales bacterium]